MRGADRQTAELFSYLSPEALVPPGHPLRRIRPLVNAALERLSTQSRNVPSLPQVEMSLVAVEARAR